MTDVFQTMDEMIAIPEGDKLGATEYDLIERSDRDVSHGVKRAEPKKMSAIERGQAIAQLTSDVVPHTAFETCIELITSMQTSRQTKARTPRGMLITGSSGSGKSTIAEEMTRTNSKYEREDRTIIPVLYVELPGQPTAKVIAERILNAMGDPFSERGGAEQKLHRIRKLLVECEVELLILDEFQHITDNLDGRSRDIAADTLKNLMNETRVPFLFIGGPTCRPYFVKNQQLGRRCTPKVVLRRFGLATPEEKVTFQKLLKAFERRLPFDESSALVDVAAVEALWFASFGLIGQLTQLIQAALELALKAGATTLTSTHLKRAFAESVYVRCPRARNPFDEKFDGLPLTKAGEPFHGFEA